MIVVYIIGGIILGLLLVAYFLPGSYMIEKSIIIKKNAEFVMDRIGDLNFYSQWNPWQQSDPTAKGIISGNPKMRGHKYEWEGKKVGTGSLTLKSIDNKHIHFDLEFIKPFSSRANDNWLFEPWGDGSETKITWQNSGQFPYPVARLMGPVITKQLNKQFEEGLHNLKKMCEG